MSTSHVAVCASRMHALAHTIPGMRIKFQHITIGMILYVHILVHIVTFQDTNTHTHDLLVLWLNWDVVVIFCARLVESWQDRLVSPQGKPASSVESTGTASPVYINRHEDIYNWLHTVLYSLLSLAPRPLPAFQRTTLKIMYWIPQFFNVARWKVMNDLGIYEAKVICSVLMSSCIDTLYAWTFFWTALWSSSVCFSWFLVKSSGFWPLSIYLGHGMNIIIISTTKLNYIPTGLVFRCIGSLTNMS